MAIVPEGLVDAEIAVNSDIILDNLPMAAEQIDFMGQNLVDPLASLAKISFESFL